VFIANPSTLEFLLELIPAKMWVPARSWVLAHIRDDVDPLFLQQFDELLRATSRMTDGPNFLLRHDSTFTNSGDL
jgi:hypothetical protein